MHNLSNLQRNGNWYRYFTLQQVNGEADIGKIPSLTFVT